MTLFNEQTAELLALRASVKSLGEKLEASHARIELLEHDAKTGDYETLYAQAVYELQVSHAREAQLREAGRLLIGCINTHELSDSETRSFLRAQELIALPSDDTALKARLKAERERCAREVDHWAAIQKREGHSSVWAEYVSNAIRNLGDQA